MRWLWHVTRLPVLIFLVILRPIVWLVCGALALLGLFATAFFEFINAPHFPAVMMLLISLGFGFLLALYEAMLRALSA